MNIVYISREYPPSIRMGGIASYVKEIALGMSNLGHNVTVITASDDTRVMSDIYEDGIRVIRLDGGDFFLPTIENGNCLKKARCIYRFLIYRRKLKNVIKSLSHIDVVEVADYAAEGLFLYDVSIPIIVRLHTPSLLDRDTLKVRAKKLTNPYGLILMAAEKYILRKAQYVTSCSETLLEWVKNNCNFNPRLVSVIKNPVSSINLILYKDVEFSNEVSTIFYAGTISQIKGVNELYEACKILNEKGKHVELLMAGKKGEYGCRLEEKVKKNCDDTWCHFLGHCQRSELYKYYATSTLCCFPSWWENMPMVCLEAMMCGGIVIGGNSGGFLEIIRDGENGFIAPIRDVEGLANCIEKVLSMSDISHKKIRKCAQQTIKAEFSTSVIAAKMEIFYKNAITDFHSNLLNIKRS